MMPEDRAARLLYRIVGKGHTWDEFERRLASQNYPGWNQLVGIIADEIREACQAAVEQELITGKILRGEISADEAKWMDSMQWEREYEHCQLVEDQDYPETDWGFLREIPQINALLQRLETLEQTAESLKATIFGQGG